MFFLTFTIGRSDRGAVYEKGRCFLTNFRVVWLAADAGSRTKTKVVPLKVNRMCRSLHIPSHFNI